MMRDGSMRALVAVLLATLPALGGEVLAPGTLSGRMVDAAGRPVAGARIALERLDMKVMDKVVQGEARTDGDGRFRLGPVEPFASNRFDLFIDAEGFARGSIPPQAVAVYPGRDFDSGTIRLERGRVFTGQVLDVDGKPRAGAVVEPTVYRHSLGHTVDDIGPAGTVATDGDGRFRTPPLPVGQLALTVRVADRRLAFAGRPIRPGDEEDLGAIHLEPDVPVEGTVVDPDGAPLAGVEIGGTVGHDAVTDAAGRFALRGFGPDPTFQLNVEEEGYAAQVGMVRKTPAGYSYNTSEDDQAAPAPTPDLTVTLRRAGLIEGTVVDAETGAPVRVDQVVVCNFTRKPTGEVVLRGCASNFEPSEPGTFRAFYPAPGEYHLTFSAAGYRDAEAFTPQSPDLAPIRGIAVRMKRTADGSTATATAQTIAGTATRDGQPIAVGWATLRLCRTARLNAPNAPVLAGRTTTEPAHAQASAPIRAGAYSIDVPSPGDAWYVAIDEPGRPITLVGPIAVAAGEQRRLDIAGTAGGTIRGRVRDVPAEWAGAARVVAFTNTGLRAAMRVEPDGTFASPLLPPGEYGLKAGHDAYEDAETYPGDLMTKHPEAFQEKPDPWKRAKVVTVEAGREVGGVAVDWPR